MTTLNEITNLIKASIDTQVVESLQEAGYDNKTATKMVMQFEGLTVEDLSFESDSKF